MNLFRISTLKRLNFQGIDASLTESLDYGLAWRQLQRDTKYAKKGEWQFVYRCGYNPDGTPYFGAAWLADQTDWRTEWNWIVPRINDVLSFIGSTLEDFEKYPLPEKVYAFFSYYGGEEIFGTEYNPMPIEGVV